MNPGWIPDETPTSKAAESAVPPPQHDINHKLKLHIKSETDEDEHFREKKTKSIVETRDRDVPPSRLGCISGSARHFVYFCSEVIMGCQPPSHPRGGATCYVANCVFLFTVWQKHKQFVFLVAVWSWSVRNWPRRRRRSKDTTLWWDLHKHLPLPSPAPQDPPANETSKKKPATCRVTKPFLKRVPENWSHFFQFSTDLSLFSDIKLYY